MSGTEDTPVGNIRDLTEQVVVRTMDVLRAKLPPSEITALEALIASGEFLNSAAVLSAIMQAQTREAK